MSIDDIEILCKKCNKSFEMESMINGKDAIYICTKCKKRIFIKLVGGVK
jgi:DNA-directed RNA polymerase subunit RPC12/RpoP